MSQLSTTPYEESKTQQISYAEDWSDEDDNADDGNIFIQSSSAGDPPWTPLSEQAAQSIHREFQSWRGIIPCYVEPVEEYDEVHWSFSIRVYFKHGRGRFEYAMLTVHVTMEQLRDLDAFISQCDVEGRFHFPIKKYPKPPPGAEPYSKKIEKEMTFLKHPRLPAKTLWNRRCTLHNRDEIMEYLCLVFSSPSILLEKRFHEILEIPRKVRSELRRHSINILRSLESQTQYTNSVKRMGKRKDQYHTCYVAARPLSRKYGGDTFNFRHWALKFVGKTSLLTLEFFDQGVTVRMIPNFSASSRRAFWYWWDDQKYQNFTDRWKILERFVVNESARDLSMYVQNWLLRGAQYRVIDNNCQHFCRDIVAVLNQNKALSLCSLLEHHQVTNFIPIIGWGDSFAEYARTYQVSKQLEKRRHRKRRSSSRHAQSTGNLGRSSHGSSVSIRRSSNNRSASDVLATSAPHHQEARERSSRHEKEERRKRLKSEPLPRRRRRDIASAPEINVKPIVLVTPTTMEEGGQESVFIDESSLESIGESTRSTDESEDEIYSSTTVFAGTSTNHIHSIAEEQPRSIHFENVAPEGFVNSQSSDGCRIEDDEKDIIDVEPDDVEERRESKEFAASESAINREKEKRHVWKDEALTPKARRTGRHHFHRRKSKSKIGTPRSRRPRSRTSRSDSDHSNASSSSSSQSWFRWFTTSGFGHRYR